MGFKRLGLTLLTLILTSVALTLAALALLVDSHYRALPLLLLLLAILAGYQLWRRWQWLLQCQQQLLRSALVGDIPVGDLVVLADPGVQEEVDKMTQRIQQSTEQEERQALFFQAVLEQLDTAVLLLNADGRIIRYNSAFRRLLAQSVPATVNALPAPADRLLPLLDQANHQSVMAWEEQQLKVDIRHNQIQGHDVTLVTLQNITSELARQQQQAWAQMVKVLTHELHNSLTPIASLADTCRDWLTSPLGTVDKADLCEALTTIHNRANGLVSFVDNFQQLNRLPAPKLAPLNVNNWVSRVLRLHQQELAHVAVSLAVQPALEIQGDSEQLAQLLTNLIVNALQALAGSSSGQLSIRSWRDKQNRTWLLVSDNGPGVNNAALQQLFVPFFTTKATGSGVGLTLARQIMLGHGGQISAHSPAGGGFEVRLLFP